MPDVNYILTKTFRTQWEDFWKTRPHSTAPEVSDAIRRAAVVTDFSQLTERPRDGAQFWTVPEMPEHFLVVVKEGGEWKVIGIRRRNVAREMVVNHAKAMQVTDTVDQLVAEVKALRERVTELEARVQPDKMIDAIRSHSRSTTRTFAG